MLNSSGNKLIRGFSLVIKTLRSQSSLYLSIFLFVTLLLPSITNNQNISTNILVSLMVTLGSLVIDSVIKYHKFSKLEGIYDSYLYESDTGPKLKIENTGVYKVSYEGDYQISVKKIQSLKKGWENYLWEGLAEIPDTYIGALYWQYTSPDGYKNYVGYKKVVIPKSFNSNVKIYLFGEDGIIAQREVLIKRPNN